MADFIPAQDLQALAWMRAFSDGIAANTSRYMLSGAESAAISAAVDDLAAALAVTSSDETRTKVTVAGKDRARASAEQICRLFVNAKFSKY